MKTKEQKLKDIIVKKWCSEWNNNFDELFSESYISFIYAAILTKYNFCIEYITKNAEIINWKALSMNKSIDWNIDFLLKHKEKFDWYNLSRNKGINHTLEVHELFIKDWDFIGLIESRKVIADKKFLLQNKAFINQSINDLFKYQSLYEGVFDYNILLDFKVLDSYIQWIDWKHISCTSSMISSIEFLRKYENYLDWEVVSKNLDINDEGLLIDILQEFKDKLSWEILIDLPCCKNSAKILELFEEKFQKKRKFDLSILSKELRAKLDLIDGIEPEEIDTRRFYPDGRYTIAEIERMLNDNETVWNVKLLSTVLRTYSPDIERFDWGKISSKSNVTWDAQLLSKYKKYLNWKYLSRNRSIIWDDLLLEKFRKYVNWDEIISNPNINFDLKFFKKFKKYLGLKNDSSAIYNSYTIEWNSELLDLLKKELKWKSLINNTNIIWTKELIYSHKHYWFKAFSECEFEKGNGPRIHWDLYILSKIKYWDKFLEAEGWWDLENEENIEMTSWMDCIVAHLTILDIEMIYNWSLTLSKNREEELKQLDDEIETSDEDIDIIEYRGNKNNTNNT